MKFILTVLLSLSLFAPTVLRADEPQKSKMLGLRTAIYIVGDLEAAKDWYTKAFAVSPYFDESYYVGFNVRGFELGLMPKSDAFGEGSNVIAYWGVEDIDTEYKRLIKLGASAESPIADVGGGIRLGTVTDPFGNSLGLIYNPLFKAK